MHYPIDLCKPNNACVKQIRGNVRIVGAHYGVWINLDPNCLPANPNPSLVWPSLLHLHPKRQKGQKKDKRNWNSSIAREVRLLSTDIKNTQANSQKKLVTTDNTRRHNSSKPIILTMNQFPPDTSSKGKSISVFFWSTTKAPGTNPYSKSQQSSRRWKLMVHQINQL